MAKPEEGRACFPRSRHTRRLRLAMECVAAFPPYTYLPHDLLPSVWEPRVLPEWVSTPSGNSRGLHLKSLHLRSCWET